MSAVFQHNGNSIDLAHGDFDTMLNVHGSRRLTANAIRSTNHNSLRCKTASLAMMWNKSDAAATTADGR